jgi:hypothetical protein
MTAKHTPGPWEARQDYRSALYIVGPDSERIANSPGGANSNPAVYAKGYANARLIAAAPELLEALGKLLNTLPTERGDLAWARMSDEDKRALYDAAIIRARDAIAKAEGR